MLETLAAKNREQNQADYRSGPQLADLNGNEFDLDPIRILNKKCVVISAAVCEWILVIVEACNVIRQQYCLSMSIVSLPFTLKAR